MDFTHALIKIFYLDRPPINSANYKKKHGFF